MAAPAKLHGRARFFRFSRTVNSIAAYVWRLPMCRSARNDGYAAQTIPTPDLTLTLTLTLGGLEVSSRGRQGQY